MRKSAYRCFDSALGHQGSSESPAIAMGFYPSGVGRIEHGLTSLGRPGFGVGAQFAVAWELAQLAAMSCRVPALASAKRGPHVCHGTSEATRSWPPMSSWAASLQRCHPTVSKIEKEF